MTTVYDFSAKTITGEDKSLKEYEGKVLVIVNTASKCGFTPQYKELEALYEKYNDQGFEILGFPCNQFMKQEPGTEADIQEFCHMHYGVTFPMFSKIDVKGKNAHPLFQYLTKNTSGVLSSEVKWNFTKFLINKKGEVVNRFAPATSPEKMVKEIEQCLAE
ncbi:glutathione peroxidase [Massilibacterium senegalense]|uniref:glutathione peroxidase n=1 Tax=Massilibacterium senegalense TaxID=1632858 RepID=UPI000784C465|nr:glutathione peroxidase [Massilibacterium senegalense]